MSGGQQEQSNPPIKATAGNVHYTYAATKTRMWLDQCRQVCVNFWRVETDRIRGAGRCGGGSAELIHVRYFVAYLDDPNRVPSLICSDGTSSENAISWRGLVKWVSHQRGRGHQSCAAA
jgi:hypothetical protein